jgi:SAM-dependent methyltransferase
MHITAMNFCSYMTRMLGSRRRVCELGSRNINGTVRHLFPGAEYIGVDAVAGSCVDVVADAADYRPADGHRFDTVVSTELLEHAERAPEICLNAFLLLDHGGVFILTAAGDGRPEHSAEGNPDLNGQFYRNVSEALLREWLRPFGLVMIDLGIPSDIYAMAVKTS